MNTIEKNLETTTEPAPASAAGLPETPQARPYQAPELHEVGSLEKLQHYGFYYHDGYRYKNDY